MLAGLNGTDMLISKTVTSEKAQVTPRHLSPVDDHPDFHRTRTEGLHCRTNHQDQPVFPVVPNYSGAISLVSRPGSYIYCRIRMWLAEIRVCKFSHIKFVPF